MCRSARAPRSLPMRSCLCTFQLIKQRESGGVKHQEEQNPAEVKSPSYRVASHVAGIILIPHTMVLKSWADTNTGTQNFHARLRTNPYLLFTTPSQSKAAKQEHESRGHAIGMGETNSCFNLLTTVQKKKKQSIFHRTT